MSDFTKEELEQLTPEEREYLEADDIQDDIDVDSDEDADLQLAGDEPADEQPQLDAEAKQQADDASEPTEDLETEPDAEPDDVPAEPTDKRNNFADQMLQNDEKRGRLATIDTELAALAERFDEGELSAKEFAQAQMKLFDEKSDIRIELSLNQRSVDDQVNHWLRDTVPAFINQHKQYSDPQGSAYQALDAEVKRLQNQAIADGRSHLNAAILNTAHENIIKLAKQLSGVPETTPPPAVVKQKPKAQNRTMPPSLAHVPAADITETTDGGKTGYLDRLAEKDPIAHEEALAKLSDAERERYLSQP